MDHAELDISTWRRRLRDTEILQVKRLNQMVMRQFFPNEDE